MNVTTRKDYLNIEGRAVPFTELLVEGDMHTLSVRKYPKNVSVQMWKNSDKSGTKVTMKMPHDKFFFNVHIQEIVNNFETSFSVSSMDILEEKWLYATKTDSF